MFGDFGASSPRNRIPREHSPFGSFRSDPMFPGRGWNDSQMHGSSNVPPSGSARQGTAPVERIIPIKIVGSPSPPRETKASQSAAKKPVKIEIVHAPSKPIVLGWPADVTPPAPIASDTTDKKYTAQRHNTTDNLNLKPPTEDNTQRAKSEPPNTKVGEAATIQPATVNPQTTTANPHLDPVPVGKDELGGAKSKIRENITKTAGCRNIPIVVVKPGGGGGEFGQKGKSMEQQPPSKTRSQPDYSESNTTTPPPAKKITKDTMHVIQDIVEEVKSLQEQINALPYTPKTAKTYIYLDEMLTRNLIKLDTIETEGKEDIRIARRDCIKLIQKAIGILEDKSQEVMVPFTPKANEPIVDAATSSPLVPIQLALTPTTNVTPPVVATVEARMDFANTTNIPAVSKEEPMEIDAVTA